MNGPQENKRTMFGVVIGHCNNNQFIWGAYPPFVDAFDRFTAIYNNIDSYAQVQTLQSQGVTEDKQNSKQLLTDKAVKLCGIVGAWASKNNNQTVKKALDYKASTLIKKRDTLFLDTINNIYNQVKPLLPNLVSYNITSTELDELSSLTKSYKSLLSTPRSKTTVRKNATTQLPVLFKQADKILKEELDGLVTAFSDTNPDFVREYTNSRMIVDLGVRHRKKDDDNAPKTNPKSNKKNKPDNDTPPADTNTDTTSTEE